MNNLRSFRYAVMSALGILSMMATVASSAPPGAPAAQAPTDISITISADRSTVRAGQNVTYTVTMTNLGPNDASFVDAGFQIPAELTLISMGCDLGISPDTPFCEYSSLPAGATVVSTLVATPGAGARGRARLATMSASVFFENIDAFDPDNANNAAAIQTKLIGRLSNP